MIKKEDLILRVLLIRILCNLIMSVVSISIIVMKICQFSFSIIYLLWGVPIILINLLDIIFLVRSSLKKPEKVDIRFSTLLISLGAALALVFTSFFLKYPRLPIPGSIYFRAFASILNLLTYPIIVWALLCLKSCLTVIPEAHKIVAHGIYKYSRHPLYMCYIIWSVSYILIFQSIPFIILSIVFISLIILRMKREEDLLLETFPEYRYYYDNTGLFGLNKNKN